SISLAASSCTGRPSSMRNRVRWVPWPRSDGPVWLRDPARLRDLSYHVELWEESYALAKIGSRSPSQPPRLPLPGSRSDFLVPSQECVNQTTFATTLPRPDPLLWYQYHERR